ncbi:hypothetical protein FNF28_01366 [Cafeteria roenbergensis]|uniref:USP domain-containing protein n=1 Tax=Cafeteria roenbergensis TaxID=33653 RepID=A0A5A8E100_CAFRO|nr:hypothetical protein FNF28_01366 [Cafeteria roenbergensis]
MALSGVDGGAAMAPTRAVVDLDVTYAAALPDPRFRRLVGPGGVGLNVNPLGEATFLWVKSGASEASDDAGCAAPPEGALGDVMLVDPDTGGVPAGYRATSLFDPVSQRPGEVPGHTEDLAALAAGDRDRLIKLADDAAALARVVTDSKRFAPLVAGSSAGHTADRVRDGVVLAMAMACLHSANATLKEAPPAGAVAPGAAVAGAAAGAVGAPGAAPLGEALAAAGATLLSDVVAAVHRGDGLVPAAGFIGPAARSASSSSSGSGAWTGQASVGRTTINPMFAGTRPAPRSAFAAASAALDDDEVEGGSAGGSAAAGPTKSSAAQAREDAAEPQDVAELRVAWPRRRLPMRWATPRWLAGHFVAEGVPGLLAQLTPPAGAASPPAWVRLSTRLLALGAETLAFAARYGAESLDDVAAQLGAAALAGTDSAAEPAAAAAWQAAAAAAFAGLCRNVGIEVLWGFWERVEAVEPASLSPAAVKLLAELTVVSADRIRARDRVPPFESRFGHGDDAKGSAGLNPQLQYHFGAHVLFELCSGAGAAASAEASGLARRLLPRVLNSTHCRIWLPGFVERAVTGLVDAAGAGGSGGGGSSAAGAGAAIETAKRLLAALPATSLGGGASQEKTLASLSAKLGGGGALAGLLLDELEDHRREALAALGLLADPEDQAAVAAAYAAEDAYASSAATSSAAAAAAAAAAQRAAAGPGDDAGAEDAAKDEAPARWAVDGAALLRAAPSGDAGALRYGGETLSAGLHSRLSFVWFVLSAARETLGAQALLRLWRVCVASAVGPGDAVSLFSALRKALPLKERQWAGSSATAKSGVVRVVVKSEAAGVVLRRLVGPAVAGPSVTPAWLPAGTSAARDDWNSQVLPAATSCLADALAFVNSREGGLELDHSSAGAARLTPFWLRALPSSLVSISALWTAAVDSEALRAAVAAAGPGGAAAEGALSAARRMLLALHSRVELSQASRVQAGRAVSPSAVWVEFVEGCLARAGQAAVAIEKLHAPVAGLMGPSESKQAAAQAAAARAVPRMEAALWLMLLFVRRLAARGALALPGKSAGGGSAKRGKGKASSSSAGGRGGIGKGLAAGKPAEPALPIGVIPSKVVDWKQPPSGGKPKTHVEVTCQVKVSLSEGRLAGRTVRHRVRLPKGSPVGDLRAHIAKDSGLCGSDRLRIRHSATNVLPRSFDELSFEDAGIGTSCSAEILPFPAEDTEGEGGFVYEGPAAVEDAADDAALDVAEASGGGAAGAAAAGSADAGAAGAGGRAGNAVPDGREEDEEEHDATSAGSTSASAPMPWLLDPFAKARAVAAAEAGAKAAAAGAAPFVSAAAAWAPLRGAGPYGAGLADPDERRAAMGLLRGQAGFTGTMLAALLAGGDAAQVAWRVLRLVPWSPQLLRAVETGAPLQLRTDQALVDRVLAGGSSAEPEHSAAPGGKGRGKGAGGRVSGAKVSSARPSSGPSWGQGSQWELLFGGREAAAVAALPALLCVERCQLFAVQSFRAGVLALDVGEDADLARQARAETGGACSGEAGCDNGDHDSLLFQLQSLFAHLHEHRGGGRAGTTAALCGAFRDWEGAPINPRVQQDATEFLSSLFQQLEGRLAGTRHARIMSAPFGLGYVCTLNADVAAARAAGAVESFSARRVDNTSVSVPVVGSDARDEGLRAGLAAFVAADEVEYRWPVAGSAKGAELRSLKRQLIGSTPPHLLLSLSRFQFDMEALCQRKVNDRIAFPSLLDVFEFTPNGQRRRRRRRAAGQGDGESAAEAVADAAGALWQAGGASTLAAAREEEEDDVGEDGEGECWERLGDGAPVPGPAGCVYVLSGVVVHRGTAQAGHYWSLARDRSTRLSLRAGSAKDAAAAARRGAVGASALGLNDAVLSGHEDAWFKLDDRRVAPFPVADMELEAFGGELTSSGQKRKADQSAFILVYDRVDPAAVAEWARLTTLEVACPDVVEFAMDVATMGNPAEPTDGTPDTGLVHEWLLTAVDTAAAPGAAEAPAVTGWWSAWLESCVSPRMLPPDMMAHKRSALERGGQGPAKAGRQAAGASAGSRGGKRRGKATGGGGGGASKAGAAAAAAEAALAGAGAEVSVDAPLWVPSWALGAEAEEPVSWDDVGAIMTAVLTSSPASGPLPARALCSGAWPAARAVVASDDDCAGLVGSTVQFQRGTGVRAKQETIEGTVTHFDAGRGAPGTGGEFCVRVDGGSRTLWHRLSYSPFRAVPPPAQLAKAAAALP